MNRLKVLLVLVALPLVAFTTAHKFHVSVTQIDYIKENEELQITSRIFIDDLEKLLKKRYDSSITLADNDEPENANLYIEKYLSDKLSISVNGQAKTFKFLGKEYEDDIAICYLEISNIKEVQSLEVSNTVLFDFNKEQQNIIRTKINSQKKSFILIQGNEKGMLNFSKNNTKP